MPECGTQCYLCDLPIRFDNYSGCSHACSYCFARHRIDISQISKKETSKALMNFISGARTKETNWCDWDIPLHWGGLSDPFQPCEKKYRSSYKCLKIFADENYPFVVSTKGRIISDKEYLNLIKNCNCVVQISMVCDKYDVLEKGCPSFAERLKILESVSRVARRTIVRVQPYMREVFLDVYKNLQLFKNAGAYGAIIEGMKFKRKKDGLVKIGGDFVYQYEDIKKDFLELKQKCHSIGLKIYAGENRIRSLGDSLTCCGVDGLSGFLTNTFNLNHILNGDKVLPSPRQKTDGTAGCFQSLFQDSLRARMCTKNSFADWMIYYYKTRKKQMDAVFGKLKI